METVGRPSRGCLRCKERHVKCPRERPECSRCIRLGRPCLGYRHQDDLLWANENDKAKRLATRPRKQSTPSTQKRNKSNASQIFRVKNASMISTGCSDYRQTSPGHRSRIAASNRSDGRTASLIDRQHRQSLPQVLQSDLQEQALCATISSLVQPRGPGKYPGFLEFLPEMYLKTTSSTPLPQALLAVSLAKFANQIRNEPLRVSAANAYNQALSATNAALSHPTQCLKDETLAAIYLLGMYELVRGPEAKCYLGLSNPWRFHANGTLLLLRLRGPEQIRTTKGQELFRLAHAPIQFNAIMHNEEPPAESRELIRAMFQESPQTSAPPSRVSWYFDRVATICARVKRLIRQINADNMFLPDAVIQVLHEAKQADASMQHWHRDYPGWEFRVVDDWIITGKTKWSQYSQVHTYQSLWTCSNHNKYRSARLLLHQALIHCIEHAGEASFSGGKSDVDEDWITIRLHQQVINDMTEAILSSVPYALGEVGIVTHPSTVGGLQLMWFLGVILRSPYVTMEQKDLTSAALKKIGYELGFRQALVQFGWDRRKRKSCGGDEILGMNLCTENAMTGGLNE